jgi:hypothetical protein
METFTKAQDTSLCPSVGILIAGSFVTQNAFDTTLSNSVALPLSATFIAIGIGAFYRPVEIGNGYAY